MNALTRFFKRLHINVFTLLMIAGAIMFAFKAVNLASVGGQLLDTDAFQSAHAVEEAAKEEPPPLNAADVKSTPDTPTDQAIAAAKDAAGKPTEGPASIEPPPTPAPPPDMPTNFSASEIEVLQSLSKRRAEMDKREQALETREALLSATEQELDKKVGELDALRDEIKTLLGQQEKMEGDRINSLVKIYENMKPKEAATIFNTLDMDVLLNVISRMSERKSSPILASMAPDKARLVTIRLAAQRKLPDAAKPEATKQQQPVPTPPPAASTTGEPPIAPAIAPAQTPPSGETPVKP